LTRKDNAEHRIKFLNDGADQILVEPFLPEELQASCAALLRRSKGSGVPVVRWGAISFETATGFVSRNGNPVELSVRERAVLEALMMRPGQVIAKSQIESRIYNWHSGIKIQSNTVEVYISSLRRKLGRNFIKTVRGLGVEEGRQ
jgi:DNA-binding response OmpR family regulator